MHVRIPNAHIKRDQWINLCIDLQSIVKDCFSSKSVDTGAKGPRANSRGKKGQNDPSSIYGPSPNRIPNVKGSNV